MNMNLKIFLLMSTLLFSGSSFAYDEKKLRLAVLAFGTVNWELASIKKQNLMESLDFQLEIRPVANPQAGKIALQSGAVDMIVSDWVWVSRQRAAGYDLSFYPYSTTSGALIVPQNSPIKTIKDLAGKKLGIAGGELDKNWLLLQALAAQQNQLDLNHSVEKIYGTPPLLNQQILHHRIDAIINYWHFAARLEGQGYQQIISGKDILHQLGIKEEVPILGYVFNRHWAKQHKNRVNQFLKITQLAKNILCQSEQAWQDIIPLTQTADSNTQNKLRERYCAGRIKQWGNREQQAATRIYTLLRQFSNNRLTGNSITIQTGTFWNID